MTLYSKYILDYHVLYYLLLMEKLQKESQNIVIWHICIYSFEFKIFNISGEAYSTGVLPFSS